MKTRVKTVIVLLALALLLPLLAQAQIYKQVDKDGNVTYTDQVPPDGSAPMDLPELSVIHMDPGSAATTETGDETPADSAAESEPTPRQLRSMYRDFRITRPAQEESIWGTGQMVVVSWGSSTQLRDDMSVNLFVDGQQQTISGESMTALTLDRGEHKVYAELLDARGRRVVTTDTVTFFVKQSSVNFKQPGTTADSGT